MDLTFTHIKKGITQNLMYMGSDKFAITKTGKEIKEKLEEKEEMYKKEKEECKAKMEALKIVIKEEPTEKASNYQFEPFSKDDFDHAPYMYSWESMKKDSASGDANGVGAESAYGEVAVKSDNAVSTNKEKYNEHARKYIRACVDYKTCELVEGNLKDNEKFKLSIPTAAALGF